MINIAILRSSVDRTVFKLVPVPEGQSLEFDEGAATRRWLWPHIDSGTGFHLVEFVEREKFAAVARYTEYGLPEASPSHHEPRADCECQDCLVARRNESIAVRIRHPHVIKVRL